MTGVRNFPSYGPDQGARIFDGIDADKAVRHICDEPGMPSMATLKHWRKHNKEFAAGYAAAMERKRARNSNGGY